MDLVTTLKSKKAKVIEIHRWGTYLRKVWEDKFANHLSMDEKKSIHLHDKGGASGFLWHIFSYEKRACFLEDQANIAFNSETKQTCYVFYQHSDDAFILENCQRLTSDDFANEADVYIVDKDFNWTYVRTHETGWCGPYFSRR